MRVGFLFDNDGVLTETSELHWLSWQLLMKEERALFMDKQTFQRGFGKRNDLILQEVAPQASEESRHAWAKRKEELFREYARGRVQILPGIENFLQLIKKKKLPRIIASSTPLENLQMLVSSTALSDYFEGFVSAEEVAHGKPAPDVFIEAATRLGLKPRDCIVIEDAPAGIRAGKAAGAFVVALATTHPAEDLTDYDLIFPSARELDLEKILDAFRIWRHPFLGFCLRKPWKYFIGVFLILVGIISFPLPFASGFFLIGTGLYVLNRDWFKRMMGRIRGFFHRK